METIPTTVTTIQFIIWGSILVVLIYLIFKRIAEKKKENFEKRDN